MNVTAKCFERVLLQLELQFLLLDSSSTDGVLAADVDDEASNSCFPLLGYVAPPPATPAPPSILVSFCQHCAHIWRQY